MSDTELDSLMFDDSFQLSRTYFAALQILRQTSSMVDDVSRSWSELRRRWDDAVCEHSDMFSADDLSITAENWKTVTEILDAASQRVQASISRKTEEIKSLRDGVRSPGPINVAVLWQLTSPVPVVS